MKKQSVLITGCSSGIGEAIAIFLAGTERFTITGLHIGEASELVDDYLDAIQIECDVTDSKSLVKSINLLEGYDIVINCAGVNYINWLQQTDEYYWDNVMDTNAKSIFLIAKLLADSLIANKGTMLNIVSNASHIPMTNSIAYNASKGAAHIMTLQLSRELAPKGVCVFGISPNKVSDTGMSKYIDEAVCELRGWTKEEAREYQLAALPAGEETPKEAIADFVVFLLSDKRRHKYLNGTVLPYGK